MMIEYTCVLDGKEFKNAIEIDIEKDGKQMAYEKLKMLGNGLSTALALKLGLFKD